MEDQLGALGLVLNCVTLWNHGHYTFQLPDLGGHRRALRDPDSPADDSD